MGATMTKGDRVIVRRGPLSGMTVELLRQDIANRAWYAHVMADDRAAEKVLVYDYELAETIERKGRAKNVKKGI